MSQHLDDSTTLLSFRCKHCDGYHLSRSCDSHERIVQLKRDLRNGAVSLQAVLLHDHRWLREVPIGQVVTAAKGFRPGRKLLKSVGIPSVRPLHNVSSSDRERLIGRLG